MFVVVVLLVVVSLVVVFCRFLLHLFIYYLSDLGLQLMFLLSLSIIIAQCAFVYASLCDMVI